jgi:hypothetical protein
MPANISLPSFAAIAIAAGLLIGTPTYAQTTPTVAAKDKKVCRRQEVTGSIIGTKAVCHTRSEWQQIDELNKRNAEDSLDRQRSTRPMKTDG